MSNFLTSTGTLSGGQVVNKASTSTAVSSSVNPSVFGQPVTFTATVTAVAPGAGTPAGTVQFKSDGSDIGLPVALNGSGVATYATSALSVGTHVITAVYSGNASFLTSTGTLSGGQLVNKASTSTAVSSSVNPSVFGQPVTFTATVTAVAPGAGTPAGTVQFKSDGSDIGSPVALNGSGVATYATSALSVGTHVITAVYSGNVSFLTSTGTLSGGQVVGKKPTTSTVTVAPTTQQYSDKVTISATLSRRSRSKVSRRLPE